MSEVRPPLERSLWNKVPSLWTRVLTPSRFTPRRDRIATVVATSQSDGGLFEGLIKGFPQLVETDEKRRYTPTIEVVAPTEFELVFESRPRFR